MANTRVIEYLANFKAGLKIPTGAGAKKWLGSDAEGNATWQSRESTKFIVEHTWASEGAVGTGVTPGFFVKVSTGVEKKLIAVEFKIEEGTLLEFEVRRIKKEEAAAAMTGYTALKAISTKVERKEEPTVLASEDFIFLKKITSTGAKNLSVTAFVEVIVS